MTTQLGNPQVKQFRNRQYNSSRDGNPHEILVSEVRESARETSETLLEILSEITKLYRGVINTIQVLCYQSSNNLLLRDRLLEILCWRVLQRIYNNKSDKKKLPQYEHVTGEELKHEINK